MKEVFSLFLVAFLFNEKRQVKFGLIALSLTTTHPACYKLKQQRRIKWKLFSFLSLKAILSIA